MERIQNRKVNAVFFSPTGSTARVTELLAETIAEQLGLPCRKISYTLPKEREEFPGFSQGDLIVWGTPVYAGRIPNKTLDFVRKFCRGDGNPAVAVAVYGNRNFDNTLAELTALMYENGLHPLAAAAVPVRHTFSKTLACGRPDAADLARLKSFGLQMAEKMIRAQAEGWKKAEPDFVPGNPHPDRYYTPRKTDGTAARFLKALPQLEQQKCSGCGRCADVCPMGVIRTENSRPVFGHPCIKCQACIRYCPGEALHFEEEEFLSHVEMLERNFTARREAELYLSQ